MMKEPMMSDPTGGSYSQWWGDGKWDNEWWYIWWYGSRPCKHNFYQKKSLKFSITMHEENFDSQLSKWFLCLYMLALITENISMASHKHGTNDSCDDDDDQFLDDSMVN